MGRPLNPRPCRVCGVPVPRGEPLCVFCREQARYFSNLDVKTLTRELDKQKRTMDVIVYVLSGQPIENRGAPK